MTIGLLSMSLAASVLILAVIVIRAVGMNRLPKRVFLVLWAIALLRLMVPLSLPVAILPPAEGAASVTGGTLAQVVEDLPLAGTAAAAAPTPGTLAPDMPTTFPFALLWAIGLAACAAFYIIAYVRSYRRFACSLPITDASVLSWQQAHPLRRPLAIRESDRIHSPLTYGILRPVILLPKSMDRSDPTRLDYVLTHEWVHIRRLDSLFKALVIAVLCVHWFNPLVWIMWLLVGRDIELACDEAVLRRCNASLHTGYARMLLEMESNKSTTLLYSSFSKYAIEERIQAMLNMKRTGLLSTLVALMLVIAATTAFATVVPSDPAPAADLVNLIEDTGNSLVLDRTVDGEREISTDGGNTWMTPDEYEATQGTLNIEWWTVETYEEWLRTEKIELPKIIGSRSYNQIDGWFTWTQARVDETIAMYESTLEDLKNGMMVSRSVDGKDDLKIATMPDSDSVSFSNKTVASDGGVLHEDRAQTDAVASDVTFSLSQSTKAETQEGYSATITLNDGEEYILDSFATKAERYDAVQSFCLRMIEAGRMTSSEAEDILETIK